LVKTNAKTNEGSLFMQSTSRQALIAALFTSTALAATPAIAQDTAAAAAEENSYDQIVVTAQKREENLQSVPISIQAIGSEKLQDLGITDFAGYAQQLPSVSFQALGGTPGTNVVYMRGVASGGDGNHSGSLPSVGVYLDEQPVTTIGGNLDVHIYDIARIESLSGPQGTLYGASSEAGTIRIITNKPSTSGFEGTLDAEVNAVLGHDFGGKLEGMVNAPLGDAAALRVVGFYQRDGGYISNVAGTRRFLPTPGGITVNNNAFVEEDYNDTEIYGARAALKIDLDDSWTVTPSVMYQHTEADGSFAFDQRVGDLKVQRFFPESRTDKFVQAALTIEGQIGNWDLTYAGAYLDRQTASSNDYTDYSEAYDSLYSSVGGIAGYFYFSNSLGATIDPRQRVIGSDHFKKLSQELRISSPADAPLRLVAGLFYQRQTNDILQDYQVPNLAVPLSVNSRAGTLWLTKQYRVDKDYAAFGELSFDVSDKLTLTAGVRGFRYDNTLVGFFGFGRDPAANFSNTPFNAAGSSRTGVAGCFTTTGSRLRPVAGTPGVRLAPPVVAGSPCTNLGVWNGSGVDPVRAKGDGVTWRFNGTYKPSEDFMVYATVSRGFRPGGINRRADVAPYDPDYLVNYELGWKATLGPGMRLNGAIYEQRWNSFQFSFLGANSFTEIHNGPDARIRGFELDFAYNRGPVNFSLAASYNDTRTLQNLCLLDDPSFTCTRLGPGGEPNLISAPAGIRLPVTPKFKLSGTLRYTGEVGTTKLYGQVNAAYQSSATSDIRTAVFEVFSGNVINPAARLGNLPAFTTVNLSFGAEFEAFDLELFVTNLFDERGQISRFQQCGSCGQRPYAVPTQPRTIGIRAGIDF
jgi:iron complex outermembrane recepter protein